MINIKTISNSIKRLYNSRLKTPANRISSAILGCSLIGRPGLSSIISTTNTINTMSKNGLPCDSNTCGNQMNIVVDVIIKEIIRAIKEDANIQVAISPNELHFIANGANVGGPITLNGMNINYVKGVGLIQ